MAGVIDELGGFDLANVSAAVGTTSFKRGEAYARGRRVLSVGWDPDGYRLTGSVAGHGGLYSTTAFFRERVASSRSSTASAAARSAAGASTSPRS